MRNSLISIIVPAYNVKNEIERCVQSLISQTYSHLEVILVDDGSTDGTAALCDEFERSDTRIAVIHKQNGGLSSARNVGLRAAKGEWILYVDGDDYILPESCDRLIEAGERAQADIVVGDAVQKKGECCSCICHNCIENGIPFASRDFIIKSIQSNEFYAPACFNMYKHSFLVSNSLYFIAGLLHEDMEMQPRVFLAAKTIIYVAFPFYRYLDRPSSIMNSSKMQERIDALSWIYMEWKRRFDNIEDHELRSALYGHLAKCYLYSCCDLKQADGFHIDGITNFFMIRSGLNAREKAKGIIFSLCPNVYLRLSERVQC